MMKALVYRTDKSIAEEMRMEMPIMTWLQKTIGCEAVELVPCPGGQLWVDLNGKLDGLKSNIFATAVFGHNLRPGDFICGDAVFIPGDSNEN